MAALLQDIRMGDDSYRGPPVTGCPEKGSWLFPWTTLPSGFDDSQGAGITAFKTGTSLKPSGPTDFGFLLGPFGQFCAERFLEFGRGIDGMMARDSWDATF